MVAYLILVRPLRGMSIEQRKIIDAAGVRQADGRCVLTITDHLEWYAPEHLPNLKRKIDDYIAFIESGEIYERFPDAREREIEIEVVCSHYPPIGPGVSFMQQLG